MLLLFGPNTFAAEDLNIPLLQHEAWLRTNVWIVPASRLETMPTWKSEAAEPPLSVGRAAALAKDWVVSKGAATNAFVEHIEIRFLNNENSKSKYFGTAFYVIHFGNVGNYGHHMTGVVLMDGSIAEMNHLGTPSSKKRYIDYLD